MFCIESTMNGRRIKLSSPSMKNLVSRKSTEPAIFVLWATCRPWSETRVLSSSNRNCSSITNGTCSDECMFQWVKIDRWATGFSSFQPRGFLYSWRLQHSRHILIGYKQNKAAIGFWPKPRCLHCWPFHRYPGMFWNISKFLKYRP